MICSAPTIGLGCGNEVVPVTASRVNGTHHLCPTCTAIACSRFEIKGHQIRDLEWAIATVRRAREKAGLTGAVPAERVRAAIQYLEDNPGKLTPPGKENLS